MCTPFVRASRSPETPRFPSAHNRPLLRARLPFPFPQHKDTSPGLFPSLASSSSCQSAELEGSSTWRRAEVKLDSFPPPPASYSRLALRRRTDTGWYTSLCGARGILLLAENKKKEILARDSKRGAPRARQVACCSRIAQKRAHKSARSLRDPPSGRKERKKPSREIYSKRTPPRASRVACCSRLAQTRYTSV
jgi:hypothetical protein